MVEQRSGGVQAGKNDDRGRHPLMQIAKRPGLFLHEWIGCRDREPAEESERLALRPAETQPKSDGQCHANWRVGLRLDYDGG